MDKQTDSKRRPVRLHKRSTKKVSHGFQKGNKHGNRWKAGESGNPAGRAKGSTITKHMRENLELIPKNLPDGDPNEDKLTWAQIIGMRIIFEAGGTGGVEFIKVALDRMEGKVPETLRHGLDEYSPELVSMIRNRFKR